MSSRAAVSLPFSNARGNDRAVPIAAGDDGDARIRGALEASLGRKLGRAAALTGDQATAYLGDGPWGSLAPALPAASPATLS